MLLSEQIKTLCKEHELNSLSIGFHDYGFEGAIPFTAYAHWDGSDGKCASASDYEPEMAIAKAVAEADAMRGRGVAAIAPIELAA